MKENIDKIKFWIEHHIAEDGHLPAETARGLSGMWYTYYALVSMTAACQIAWNAAGADLFHYKAPNGRSLKIALDYFHKHCSDPESWPFGKQRAVGARGNLNKNSFPGIWWGANLYEAMGAIYGEKIYSHWVSPVRPITLTARHHYAWNFPSLMRPLRVGSERRPGTATGPTSIR